VPGAPHKFAQGDGVTARRRSFDRVFCKKSALAKSLMSAMKTQLSCLARYGDELQVEQS